MTKEEDLLHAVIRSIVEFPEDVVIDRTQDELGVLLTLRVNDMDMGKVIGRQGNTAKAIRVILRVCGMQNKARVNLKILEPVQIAGADQAIEGGDRTVTSDIDTALEDIRG